MQPLDWYHQQATLYNICSLNPLLTQPRPASRSVPRLLHCLYCRGSEGEEEEEEEEEDLFVFNDTIEGPRAPAVKPGRITQA